MKGDTVLKSKFNGFNVIQMIRVGKRCFLLGRHEVVKDAHVVWEQGTEFKENAAHFLSERDAMAELQGRVDNAKAILKEDMS